MIAVTRLNNSTFYLNPHQIEFMEATPDTIITMVSGTKYVVRDTIDDILARIVEYRTRIVSEHAFRSPAFFGNEE